MAHYRDPNQSVFGSDATSAARRLFSIRQGHEIDEKMGFERFDSGPPRVGWLVNFQPTTVELESGQSEVEVPNGKSAVDFYFLDEMGGYFKSTIQYDPYFFVACLGRESEVDSLLRKKLGDATTLKNTEIVQKEDLSLPNHLLGNQTTLIKLTFWNQQDMQTARRSLAPIISANQKRANQSQDYGMNDASQLTAEQLIIDFKEHDVNYHVRVSIDVDIRVGKWYEVSTTESSAMTFRELPDRIERADPVVMAFDIETLKQPLKFPDSAHDAIMMISYMVDGRGYLITNREIVSEDIEGFEYTPKPEFPGTFEIFNEPSEREVIQRFFQQVLEERPTVIATFNGDFFDWPFVDARAAVHGLDMYQEIGFRVDNEGEYKSTYCAHMDCFRWVQRDSYLPQGSQGLKAVTKAKLGYNPAEVDPELMVPYAREKPKTMAEYSVSDAVATYYLYMKYVHPFIFSLCNIIPLRPDEVLRKGTGTLCEMLLMVQAYTRNIVLPHKHTDPAERYYKSHLVESETYVGGHVESLEAGVFRYDIPTHFNVDTSAVDELLAQLDDALKFTITVENGKNLEDITNYDEVRDEIKAKLIDLKENPKRTEQPLIYHVDVASMYPNIMTSNRLQPDSMKTDHDCAMCDFNVPGKNCDRRLPWAWRGEFYPAKKEDILMLHQGLQREKFPTKDPQDPNKTISRPYEELSEAQQFSLLKKRISDFSQKVYHRMRQSEVVEREAIICQRENPFYVNTVRFFRDRRYKYKGLQKQWKGNLSSAKSAEEKESAAKMIVLYDSLQLAHKCILNSFYGYVMRKGSRWYSMEMAGVTCLTGATIIQLARGMVERLGRPLELDTDGIWCILPKSFPEELSLTFKNGKSMVITYPCVMLNHLVHEKFTNHQYQTLIDEKNLKWETSSDNSIFFEVDGPYKAMMLPSSLEEGKGLKKRYAVFNFDGSLAECKGFEMKRRGELQLIKNFQQELFFEYLAGQDLRTCYDALALVANRFLDILDGHGANQQDVELMALLSENKSMSKSLDEYQGQKSASITTARRLADFLGKEMVKDKGLACRYIISAEPANEAVTMRAIPVQIFDAPHATKQEFLRKWLKQPKLEDFDPRAIIDWKYYRERLGATIQKMVVIPAARQRIPNPIPRVEPPVWLAKQIAVETDTKKQQKIGFVKTTRDKAQLWGQSVEIEDIPGTKTINGNMPKTAVVYKRKSESTRASSPHQEENDDEEVSKEHAPDPDQDYRGWIMYMKKVWRKQREQSRIRRQMFGASGSINRSKGIEGMIRKQTESAWQGSGNVWQIIQVSPTADPGRVKVAVSVNSRLQSIFINVPRQLYVQVRHGHSLPDLSVGITAEQSDYMLPSGHVSPNLYRLIMDETVYQEERVHVGGLFGSRAIETVYEDHITAVDRVLMTLGSSCQLDPMGRPGLLGKGLDSGFDLEWLVPVGSNLSKKRKSEGKVDTMDTWKQMDYAFVKHNEVHGRHIITLLNSWNAEAKVLEYAPRQSGDGGNTWASHLASEYSSQRALHRPTEPLFVFPESLNVTANEQTFDNTRKFWAAVSKAVANLVGSRSRNVICAVSCNRGRTWISSKVRTLSELPQISLSTGDSNSKPLPSIGWQLPLARRIAKGHLRSQFTLVNMCVTAAHANIPLSNVPSGDDIRQLLDIMYARKLHETKNVLWWAESNHTDKLVTVEECSKTVPVGSGIGGENAGIYPNVCLDLSVSNLVVNTILTSAFQMAAEGSDAVDPDFIVDAFNPVAWKCLVQLTREWWTQASDGDVSADSCILQLAGWIMSPSSRLWNAKLSHQISTLSNKALKQLNSEFRKFGTNVVHSERDGQRIILSTTKKSAIAALAFSSLVVKEAKAKEQFTYLDITVNETWDFLVWLNSNNYCGRLLANMAGTESGDGELDYVSTWQMIDYLSPLLSDEFQDWVQQFMVLISECKDAALGLDTQADSVAVASVRSIPSDFMKGILQQIEKPLSNRVRQLQSRYIDAVSRDQQNESFGVPKCAGSNPANRPESPILTFVKTLLAVLSAGAVDEEFIKLRRRLLAILDVGDFDSASEFKDPASKLVVRDVVCLGCMACIDVDVCQPSLSDKFSFQCPRCGVDVDRLFLEEKLVQMLATAVSSYQLQDLRCVKCGKVRPNDMAEYCPCSGQFKNTIGATDMGSSISVYKHVGKFYDLRLLNDLISQY